MGSGLKELRALTVAALNYKKERDIVYILGLGLVKTRFGRALRL